MIMNIFSNWNKILRTINISQNQMAMEDMDMSITLPTPKKWLKKYAILKIHLIQNEIIEKQSQSNL